MNDLENELAHSPHFTLGYAVRKLIESQLNGNQSLLTHLKEQRRTLSKRATILARTLNSNGWSVIKPSGGLFLVGAHLAFIEKNNSPVDQIQALITNTINVEGETLSPQLERHSLGWQLSIKSPFSGKMLIVKEDGRFIAK